MKKIFAILIATAMFTSMLACSAEGNASSSSASSEAESSSEVSSEEVSSEESSEESSSEASSSETESEVSEEESDAAKLRGSDEESSTASKNETASDAWVPAGGKIIRESNNTIEVSSDKSLNDLIKFYTDTIAKQNGTGSAYKNASINSWAWTGVYNGDQTLNVMISPSADNSKIFDIAITY